MNRVFITGDTHGNTVGEMSRFNSKNFKEGKELDKNDYVIITGDFGFIFNNNQTNEEKYWLKWMKDKPWSWATLDGNHENFNLLWSLPKAEMFDNEVRVIENDIYYLQRGYDYTIGNRKFFVFGGARSSDKERRIEGISWWKDEEPNYSDYKKALETLEKINYTCDYVLTHETASFIRNKIVSRLFREDDYQLVKFLNEILPKMNFKHHYFGHYHIDETIDGKHTCSYDKIHELEQ